MKALITGGNGFLGQHLVPLLLQQDMHVRVLGRQERFALSLPVEYYKGDIRHFPDVLEATRGVEVLFHIASKAGIESHPTLYDSTNIQGTLNVLEACRQNRVSKCIYTSSPCVVFNGKAIRNGDESLPYSPHPLCDYARTKIQAEKLILKANSATLKTIALRPHLLFGHRDQHLIPRILQRLRAGRLVRVGSGKNFVDMTHIRNAAHAHELAFLALLRGHPGGKAYFIGQERPLCLWTVIDDILQRLRCPSITRTISFGAAYTTGFFLEKFSQWRKNHQEPLMTRFLAIALSKDHYFSQRAAEQDLGYIPKISIEEAMRDYDPLTQIL
ncbi:MAG: NAD-dependent epimerase/dehydratase family protein [Puniceicoccales bacterium]|jgi:nucleoside-diphosphate-sugar epimerase|nr:NAD-dependent epimerase/dehydratase family protein [Puniceicoccales bacterium]